MPNKRRLFGKRCWVFDLDDTLHDASAYVFPHLNRSMTEYLMEHLALEETEANALRSHYWRLYGATLKGLMRHHGTDPHHFLHQTHQFPDLHSLVIRVRGLRSTLQRLPGRKVIFTNAPMAYAEAVLKLLKIRDMFDGVFSIESSRFHPKPSLIGFIRLLRHFRLHPTNCIMVEDTLSALQTAKRLGMKTIYIHPRAKQPPYVDVCIRSVLVLPRIAVAL